MSVTSTPSSPVNVMSTVTVTCTVGLNSAILESDLSLLMVDAVLSRDGTPLTLANPTVTGTRFTYTRRFESFGRSDSGNYTCTAIVTPQPSSAYLTGSDSGTSTAKITTGVLCGVLFLNYSTSFHIPGVYLTLGGEIYRNGGNIIINEIGEGDDRALLCVTDLTQCCHSDETGGRGPLGEWFYPDRSLVRVKDSGVDIYRNRGPGIVRLNRRNNATSPTGQFCCVVPDATLTNRITCIDIGEYYSVTDHDQNKNLCIQCWNYLRAQ